MYVKIEDLYKDAHNGFIAINKVIEWYKTTEAYKYFLKITVECIFSDLIHEINMSPNLNYENNCITYTITETSKENDINKIKESLEKFIEDFSNYNCLTFDINKINDITTEFKFRLK